MITELTADATARFEEFLDSARRFCESIESSHADSDIEFLKRMEETLTELHWRGQRLPEVDPWADELDDNEADELTDQVAGQSWLATPTERDLSGYWEIHSFIIDKLGERNRYHSIGDPISETDNEVLEAGLADEIATLYDDIKERFAIGQSGPGSPESPVLALWHWRFQYRHNWLPYHLLPAITVVSWLINYYWNDHDGEWWSQKDLTSADAATTLEDEEQP